MGNQQKGSCLQVVVSHHTLSCWVAGQLPVKVTELCDLVPPLDLYREGGFCLQGGLLFLLLYLLFLCLRNVHGKLL